MINFAPVCPLPIARQLAEANPAMFGNYHLLIATEVLKDPVGYNDFWTKRYDSGMILLDNGVIEEGAAVNIHLLAAAALLVNADVVVVPDVVGDFAATKRLAEDKAWPLKRLLPTGVELMGVIQANSKEEAYHLDEVFTRANIDWRAIPKGYSEREVGSRATLAHNMMAHHILGFSNNSILDDIAAAKEAGGIDSAVPIWFGAEGLDMEDPDTFVWLTNGKMKRPADYWEWQELNPDQLELVIKNIKQVRTWLNEGPSEAL